MAGQAKESQKKLKKSEKELKTITDEFEDLKRKLDYTTEQFSNLQKEHKTLIGKET